MFEFLKAAYNRVIWVLAMEISDGLITNSTGVNLWCIYNTVIYHKELKWPKLKISNRTKPTQISDSVSQKEPNTGLYHKDFGFKLTILIACNFKLLWQLYKSQEVLRMTNSFAFTLCYFTADIRDIHIECSKQFKWNLYFYCLGRAKINDFGQSRPFWVLAIYNFGWHVTFHAKSKGIFLMERL